MTCYEQGCFKPVIAQYRCSRHYSHYRYHGGRTLDHLDRMFTRILVNENGCWVWQGHKDKHGYGRTNIGNGKIRNTHVLFYEMLLGNIPKGLELDHLCMNQSCVNPDHLEPVTHAENLKRWGESLRITHCLEGHEYDSQNTYTNKLGRRICRKCSNEAGKRYRLRRRYGKDYEGAGLIRRRKLTERWQPKPPLLYQ